MSKVAVEKVYKKRVTLSGSQELVDAAIASFSKTFPGVVAKTWAKRGKAVSKKSSKTSEAPTDSTPEA